VAGVAAVYLQSNPTATAAAVMLAIRTSSTTGVITSGGSGSPNLMVNSQLGAAPPPTPTPVPTITPSPTPTPTPAPTPARVTVRKRARLLNGGTSSSTTFPYAATNIPTTSFALVDNTEFVDPNINQYGAQNAIIVTEAPVMGWALSSIQCVENSTGLPSIQNSTVDLVNRRANIVAEAGEEITCTFTSDELAPTASTASVGGRVMRENGYGVGGVVLYLYSGNGGRRHMALTNSFGYYNFTDLQVGELYILGIQQSRWTILDNVRSFTLNEDLSEMNFIVER